MPEISSNTQKLIKKYSSYHNSLQKREKEPVVSVDEISVRVASFYEKIRGVVDWKGEHFLKRGAIERVLKRKIFSQINISDGKFTKESIEAEPLIVELIRSGHFPNDTIPESKIKEIQKAIDKYIYIIKNHQLPKKNSRLNFYKWLSSIAACEIEEILSPSVKERALISYMHEHIKEMLEIEEEIKDEEKNILIYIAVHQALFDLDPQIISYHILKYKHSNWRNLQKEQLEQITENIHRIKERIDSYFRNPLLKKIYQVCKSYNTPFLIMGDVLEEDPKKAKNILANPETLEEKIKKHYQKRKDAMRGKLSRIAVYTTISIFITNIFALLVIEIPFSKLIGEFSSLAIAIDVLVPTMLMALLVVTIKPPPQRNEKKVVMETMKVAYKGGKETYKIKKARERKIVFEVLVNLVYGASFLVSLGVIVYLLSRINFPPFSYFIFIMFLSLIAFAGMKIRERAKELHMVEEKEGFLSFLIDLFAIPVIKLGKWFAMRWEKYNVVSVFFNALIDMPFMLFVEFLDQWRNFLKEKKEDMY